MKFRKKPVVIEAFQAHPGDGHTRQLPPKWLIDAVMMGQVDIGNDAWHIHTLEGRMRAEFGDWIIQGVRGELYPCKPDIFTATYEPVSG
jgi:hypothetical protein